MTALTPTDRLKLELAGLIKPAQPLLLSRLRPQCASFTTHPKRNTLSVAQARATCICIYCRQAPALYHGPAIGYSAGCPTCTVARAAERVRRTGEMECLPTCGLTK